MSSRAGNVKDGLSAFRARADNLLIGTLGAHLVLCLVAAWLTDSWGPALGVGLPAFLVPLLISRSAAGQLVTRIAVACAAMIFAALLIHQTRGVIEAHFGIFVLLAFLVLYCDWRPLVAAAALIAVHHLSFAWLQATGAGVYVFPEFDGVGRVLVHAAYVVVETGLLCYIAGILRGLVQDGMTVSSFALRVADGHLDYAFDPKQLESRPLLAAAFVAAYALAFMHAEKPAAWRGIDTEYGGTVLSGQQALANYIMRAYDTNTGLIERTAKLPARSIALYPESLAGPWTPTTADLWRPAADRLIAKGSTVMLGAEVFHPSGKYDNVIISVGSDAGIKYRQRMPVPISMWRPYSNQGAVAHWFDSGVFELHGQRVAALICYEQLLVWPALVSLAHNPQVIVAPSNAWWSRDTSIPDIQRTALRAWARLFDVPLVTAFNI